MSDEHRVEAEPTAEPDAGLDPALRDAIAELDDYLEDEPAERLAELTLPFGSRWVLPLAGLDLGRLREEAQTFYEATPFGDRILRNYPGQLAYWVSQRMLVVGDEQIDLAHAAARLDDARAALAAKADDVEAAGFARVAAGFRAILEESAGDSPPADLLWNALARRIAESVLPD